MSAAISPKWALLSVGMLKLNPAPNIVTAINGNVKSNNDRRPKVSMVNTAGNAPTKLTKPKTQEANKAPNVENPASVKIYREVS